MRAVLKITLCQQSGRGALACSHVSFLSDQPTHPELRSLSAADVLRSTEPLEHSVRCFECISQLSVLFAYSGGQKSEFRITEPKKLRRICFLPLRVSYGSRLSMA